MFVHETIPLIFIAHEAIGVYIGRYRVLVCCA